MGLDMGAFEQAWRLLKEMPQFEPRRDVQTGDETKFHPSVQGHLEQELLPYLENVDPDAQMSTAEQQKAKNKLIQVQIPPSPFPYRQVEGGGTRGHYKQVRGPDGQTHLVYDDEGTFIPPE